MFTDRDAADGFRAETYPGHELVRFDTGTRFAQLLAGLRGVVGDVAFDPFRLNMRVIVVAADELIRTLS